MYWDRRRGMNDETFTVSAITYTQEQRLFDKIHRYKHSTCFWGTIHDHCGQKKLACYFGFVFYLVWLTCVGVNSWIDFARCFEDLGTDGFRLLRSTDTAPQINTTWILQLPITFHLFVWLGCPFRWLPHSWSGCLTCWWHTYTPLWCCCSIKGAFYSLGYKHEWETTGVKCVHGPPVCLLGQNIMRLVFMLQHHSKQLNVQMCISVSKSDCQKKGNMDYVSWVIDIWLKLWQNNQSFSQI